MVQTTAIFAEILIVGMGTTTAIVLAISSFLGHDWLTHSSRAPAQSVLAVLFVSYLLGIITDRVADALLQPIVTRLRNKWFPERAAAYYRSRAFVYERTSFRDLFEYSRSRLRIVRGWIVNGVLLIVTSNLFVVSLPKELPGTRIGIATTGLLLSITAGCVFSWVQLAKAEARNVFDQEDLLKESFRGNEGS